MTEPQWQQIRDELGIVLPMPVPRIHVTGIYNNLPWFLSDYIAGHILADAAQPENVSELVQSLPVIVETIHAIASVHTEKMLPRDREQTLPAAEQLIQTTQAWLPDIPEDMAPLLSFIQSRIAYIKEGVCHGDFVPWHMIVSDRDNRIYLIDNEATSLHRVAFYDLAYLYHRLYTKLRRPDIADMLLQAYMQIYPSDDDRECFLAVLASRIIGDTKMQSWMQDGLEARIEHCSMKSQNVCCTENFYKLSENPYSSSCTIHMAGLKVE